MSLAHQSGNPLEGAWVGFPNADALEAGTIKDVGQHKARLHNARQPNAGLHYVGQNDTV
jgi:hypothetical protein